MNTIADEQALITDLKGRLDNIYPDKSSELSEKIMSIIRKYLPFASDEFNERWNQEDVLLITYGDSIVEKDQKPLHTLHKFLTGHLKETFSSVHILPFFPYSSDDGFSVIDYRVVDEKLGDWEDISRIANSFKLMVDLVINHVSRESLWFYDFVANRHPARDYFMRIALVFDIPKQLVMFKIEYVMHRQCQFYYA